jgi:acetolactate synthase-1/2/3 large subunit
LRRVNAGEAFADILDREGVRYVFGIPGGPVLGLCDAIERHPRIQLVLTKHEQAAAYAAFAYAQMTGSIGVCMSTLGPGATNLLAGLPVAAVESVPVLAITGEVQLSGIGRGAHQESSGWFRTPDQRAMFAGVCKNSSLCADPERLPDLVRHAIRIARAGRPGPTHVSIPSGTLEHSIHYTSLAPEAYRLISSEAVDDDAAKRIAERIARAKKPVLFLGGRAARPSVGLIAEELADRAAMAIASDAAGKSVVDESHELYLGCLGVLGHRAAERFVKDSSDLILAVGQTFDEISTLAWDPAFATGRDLIQLDICEEEIGKAFPVRDASVGHLPTLLSRILFHMPEPPSKLKAERYAAVTAAIRQDPPFSARDMQSAKMPMLPQRVVADLREGLPDEALILSDSSKWARWLGKYFRAARGQIVSAHDYEPMGWAVAGAIGAKLARPNQPVVCVSGDGAFLMSAMELSTASNLGIKVIWIVMNDSRLGIIHDLQKSLFGGRMAATTFENPDFASFAKSLGIGGQVVTRPGELRQVLKDAVAAETSVLLDVRFDADEIPAVRPRSLMITKGMGLPNPTPGPETTRALLKMLKEK